MAPSILQIKVSAVKRLLKEEGFYKLELLENERYFNHIKASNADAYEVKKQSQILEESHRIVSEVLQKISQHKNALGAFLKSYQGEENTTEAHELAKC